MVEVTGTIPPYGGSQRGDIFDSRRDRGTPTRGRHRAVDPTTSRRLGPDGHLIEVLGDAHRPLEMLPGFVQQGLCVGVEG